MQWGGRMWNNEWQPIETAPKNGTSVLVWDRYNISIAHFEYLKKNRASWVVDDSFNDQWDQWLELEALYWMPLPESPEC